MGGGGGGSFIMSLKKVDETGDNLKLYVVFSRDSTSGLAYMYFKGLCHTF